MSRARCSTASVHRSCATPHASRARAPITSRPSTTHSTTRAFRLLLVTALLGPRWPASARLTVCGWTGCKFYQKADGRRDGASALYPADYEARLDESPDYATPTEASSLIYRQNARARDAKAQAERVALAISFPRAGGATSLFRRLRRRSRPRCEAVYLLPQARTDRARHLQPAATLRARQGRRF